jgi:hypothetical protein
LFNFASLACSGEVHLFEESRVQAEAEEEKVGDIQCEERAELMLIVCGTSTLWALKSLDTRDAGDR